ncbi:MAG TPA: hypothetical protein PK082_05250, partial [Phycisphaerae bacterium]|nr:hypothetical protein [Phycisphaerae bacterium]
FTALTVALLAQTRLLADLGGAALGGGLLWTTLSAALLVVALRKSDHKSHPPGEAQIFGAAVGLPGAAILQAAIAVLAGQALAAGERFAAAAMAFLAAAAQVPLSALAAEIVSHQRRGFVVVGGRAREYLAAVAGGACAGVLAYAAGGWLAGGRVLLLTAVAATVAGGVIAALSWAKKIAAQVRWAAWGCVLLCAAVGALLLALRGAAEAMGRASPGVWLSGRAGFDGRPAGVLGGAAPRRSDAITSALRDTFERRPGRWWIVASSCEDIPRPLPESVRAVWSAPDPSAVPPCDWAAMVSDRDGGFLQAAQSARPEAGRQRFEGVLLTPLPADHGRAWRCFNTRALQRCAERLHRGGVFALRTQASGAHAADALAAARSLVEAIGPCWIVVAAEIDGVDLLTVGPMANVAPPQGREGAFVVSSDVLFARYGEVLPIRATAGPTHHGPDGRKLQVWLELGYGVE